MVGKISLVFNHQNIHGFPNAVIVQLTMAMHGPSGVSFFRAYSDLTVQQHHIDHIYIWSI